MESANPPFSNWMRMELVLFTPPSRPIAVTSTGCERMTCQMKWRLYPARSRMPLAAYGSDECSWPVRTFRSGIRQVKRMKRGSVITSRSRLVIGECLNHQPLMTCSPVSWEAF